MSSPARVLGAVVLTVLWFSAPAFAQLPDLGGGGGGGGGGNDLGLPIDPGDLGGALGGLGGAGAGGGSDAGVGGTLRVPNPTLVVVDHAAAVKAVQDHRALPLDDLLKSVAKTTKAEVIDVELVRAKDTLLYQVKLLDRGTVSLAYFNAASGKPAAVPR